jgi:hypothetical protein
LLANIYLHYVLDRWARQWRRRHARGDVIIVRFADDFVAGFEHRSDAERFLVDLRGRLAEFGLELAAEALLFSESHGRAVVTCAPEHATAVAALAQELGVLAHRIGSVSEPHGVVRLRLRDALVEHPVDRLRQVYFLALPRRMGD